MAFPSSPTANQVFTSPAGTVYTFINGAWKATGGSASGGSSGGVGAVASVAGKTGAVVLTSTDVGLANVDNTADLNKPLSTATQSALGLKADTTALTSGLASKQNTLLQGNNITIVGNTISATSVKEVLEFASSSAFPVTGLIETLYIAKDSNSLYRWSGTAYVSISVRVTTATTAPVTATAGDFWFNPTAVILYFRVNDGTNDIWLDISTASGTTAVSTTGGSAYETDVTSISILEILMDYIPANFTAFPSQVCNSLVITADSTVELEYIRNGVTANPVKVPRNSTKLVVGITNANQISIRRADYATVMQGVVQGYITGTSLYVSNIISGTVQTGCTISGAGIVGTPYVTVSAFGVTSATVVGGSGYTTASVSFAAPSSGVTATGTVQLTGGVVTGITITHSGSGYTSNPVGTIIGDGTGASALGIIRLATNLAGTYTISATQTINTLTTFNLSNPSVVQCKAVVGGTIFGTGVVVSASLVGAGVVTLGNVPCTKLSIDNTTGFDLLYSYGNTVFKSIKNGESTILYGLTNANQVKIAKVDTGAPTIVVNVEAFSIRT